MLVTKAKQVTRRNERRAGVVEVRKADHEPDVHLAELYDDGEWLDEPSEPTEG